MKKDKETIKLNPTEFEKFCVENDLEIEKMICLKCGESLIANIPINLEDGSAGLKCPPCPTCGNKGTPQILTINDTEMCSILDRMTNSFQEEEEEKKVLM